MRERLSGQQDWAGQSVIDLAPTLTPPDTETDKQTKYPKLGN